MSGSIPMSPEEAARVNAYYGGAGLSSSASVPPATLGPEPGAIGTPPPETGPAYDYWGGGRDPSAEPTPVTAPPPAPFSWNAPGYENATPHPFGMGAPPPGTGPAKPAGVPTLARGAAQSDLEPGTPTASPESSKAAAAALAHYGGVSGPAKPAMSSGGGGMSAGPSALAKAQGALRGSYDEEKGATQRGADTEKDRSALLAEGAQAMAQQKRDDAAIQQMEAANAAEHFKTYQEETQRQIDDVRTQKINPNRLYADSGSAVMAVIGGALGGLYQGLNHLSNNPFLDQMNKNIDRDIAAQETDLKTKKESISERKGLLSEMRATYKDDALAKMQARNLYYEAAKEDLAAQASEYDSPAIQSRADMAIAAITREQAKLDIQKAMQEAAARAAAGAAAEHRRQVDFENALKLHGARVEDRKLDIEAGKEGTKAGQGDAQRFVGTGKDAQGNPTGYLERNAESAKERETATIAAQKLIKQLDRVQEIRREQGFAGRTASEAVHGLYDTKAANELAVLESDMTTTAAQAAHLGALSESDRGLMTAKFRNLNSPGSGPDERLEELRRIAQSGLDAERESASGARATKVIGPDGREHIVVNGGQNAPNNQKVTPRERVGP